MYLYCMSNREKFILENSHLFWYIPPEKIASMSDEQLSEFILNYADIPQIAELTRIIGNQKLAQIIEKNILKKKQGVRQNFSEAALRLFGNFYARKGLLKHTL